MCSKVRVVVATVLLGAVLAPLTAGALPQRGEKIANFKIYSTNGEAVNLHDILPTSPNDADQLAVIFFFTPDTGRELAKQLHNLYDNVITEEQKKLLRIIAIGMEADETALTAFAKELGISYGVVRKQAPFYSVVREPDGQSVENAYGAFASLPVTFIVTSDKTLLKAIGGGGKVEADTIRYIAQTYLAKGQPKVAEKVAEQAGAPDIKAYAQLEQGKLDEPEQEFAKIDSKAGLAAVALKKGEYDKAINLAEQAPQDGYAQAVKGEALMRKGQMDDADKAFEAASAKPLDDWQMNQAMQGQGRAKHEKGDLDGAIKTYEKALELNPWDVKALSNESAAYQDKGDLPKAEEVLKRAQSVAADDEMVKMMLRQVQQQLENANNIKRRELIRKQIADLKQRYQELKAAGKDKPADDWTSRPLVVAFLPSEHKEVFFERAGTDLAIQREIESRLQADGRVQVVEREMLDVLLQELNLGSSELANPDTQLQLGKVLSAQLLGFADYTQAGPAKTMYLRMVDTETTKLDTQLSKEFSDAGGVNAFVDGVVKDLTDKLLAERRLQGLVADLPSAEEVYINLGQGHGVKVGQKFTVLQDGPPIEVGGKVLGHRPVPVATIEVTEVDEQLSLCKVVQKKEGVELTKNMKVKEVPPSTAPQA